MGRIFAIIFFAFIISTYGYALLRLTKTKLNKEAPLALLEILGVGLAVFSFMGIILNLLHIPVHFLTHVIIAAVYVSYELYLSLKNKLPKWSLGRWKRAEMYQLLIVIVIALALFAMFHKGAFGYPYLENDDSWSHALAVNYVGNEMQHSIDAEGQEANFRPYLEPYPPTYGMIMGTLWRFTLDTMWTMKFFNALLCALAVLFIYLLYRGYFDNYGGVLAALTFAVLPGAMSHFIWSQTLALAVLPVAVYAVFKAREEKSWVIPAIVVIASMMVTQPVVSFIFGLVIILFVVLIASQEFLGIKKKSLKQLWNKMVTTKRLFIVGAAGLAGSFLFWGHQFLKYGLSGTTGTHGSWGGQAYLLQKYSLWNEVINAPLGSRIDQAIGWGLGATLLVFLSILIIIFLFKKTLSLKKHWEYWHILVWFGVLFFLTFLPSWGFNSYGSARMWAYMAIPLSVLVGAGTAIIAASLTKKSWYRIGVIAFACLLVFMTSYEARYAVQTATWPPGVHWNAPQQEIAGYIAMQQQLPYNTKVLGLCDNSRMIAGYNMQVETWKVPINHVDQNAVNMTPEEVIAVAKEYDYPYLLVDAGCVGRYDVNQTNEFINGFTNKVIPVINQQGFLLLQVV